MKINKNDLKNPIRVKTFNYCSLEMRNIKGASIYNDVVKMLKYFCGKIEDDCLGYNIATEFDSSDFKKLIIFCEKEQKKEISKAIKDWWDC